MAVFATASHPIVHPDIERASAAHSASSIGAPVRVIEYTGEYVEIAPVPAAGLTLSMERNRQVSTRGGRRIAALRKGCLLTLTHERVPHELRAASRGAGPASSTGWG
jgi:hypothetical protein